MAGDWGDVVIGEGSTGSDEGRKDGDQVGANEEGRTGSDEDRKDGDQVGGNEECGDTAGGNRNDGDQVEVNREGEDTVGDPAVEVKGLSFTYDDGRKALDDVTFSVGRGERMALLGPNGAGKSTLLTVLAGLERPAVGGEALVNGTVLNGKRKPGYVPGVGILFQDPDDQIFMPTVEEDVAFGPINLGLEGEAVRMRVQMALKLTGLEGFGKRVPHHLSFGERKRVALAGVLAMEPDVLLLDEPTANLDPRGRRELMEFLGRLKCTLIVATHDLTAAAMMTEQAVVLDRRVLWEGRFDELFADEKLLERGGLERIAIPGSDIIPPLS